MKYCAAISEQFDINAVKSKCLHSIISSRQSLTSANGKEITAVQFSSALTNFTSSLQRISAYLIKCSKVQIDSNYVF